jgi:hypothetical protein
MAAGCCGCGAKKTAKPKKAAKPKKTVKKSK